MQVLVIDDDVDTTKTLSAYFKKQGIGCQVVNDGTKGLQAIRAGSFDLVLLDLQMRGFSGNDILRVLLFDADLAAKHVVVATGTSLTLGQKKQFMAAGVDEIILKPLSVEALDRITSRYNLKSSPQ